MTMTTEHRDTQQAETRTRGDQDRTADQDWDSTDQTQSVAPGRGPEADPDSLIPADTGDRGQTSPAQENGVRLGDRRPVDESKGTGTAASPASVQRNGTDVQQEQSSDGGDRVRDWVQVSTDQSSAEGSGRGEGQQSVRGSGGKGVAPAESESAEATRNQPIASTKEVSTIKATPVTGSVTTPTTHRISANSKLFNRALLVALGAMAIFAFYVSFYSIMSFANTVGFPLYVAWAFPAFIDIAILVSVGSILSAKGNGTATWKSWLSLLVFSAASVFANVLHAISLDNHEQLYAIGAGGLAALVPIGVLFATEHIADNAIDNPHAQRKERTTQADIEDEEAQRQRERELKAAEHRLEMTRLEKTSQAHTDREVASITSTQVTDETDPGAPAPANTKPRTQSPTGVHRAGSSSATSKADGEGPYAGKPRAEWVNEVAEFVRDRTQRGEDTTPADVDANFVGCSYRTAQRQLKVAQQQLQDLRSDQPEMVRTGGDLS